MRPLLTILILLEGPSYSVQCLEFDIAAQGDTPWEAMRDFADTFEREAMINNVWGAPKAPPYYWNGLRSRLCEECEKEPPHGTNT